MILTIISVAETDKSKYVPSYKGTTGILEYSVHTHTQLEQLLLLAVSKTKQNEMMGTLSGGFSVMKAY